MTSSGASRRARWWLGAVGAAGVLAGGGAGAQPAVNQDLIEEGRRLFMEETFDGNGRTCGTCHPPNNNFTIDQTFIRTLPGNDPLFVAEPSGPDLNGLEVRQLLQRNALILENLDGLDQPGVMRSVPHTLGLRTSTTLNRLGWSGDGSPGNSLRSFATGAVIQHFPKTMNREPGIDFRLPNEHELDALEAFQLSRGRQENIDLAALGFDDEVVEEGRALFFSSPSRGGPSGTRSCNGCHPNAGTGDTQRATGVAMLPSAPACGPGFKAPGDGGEGIDPVVTLTRNALCSRGPKSEVTFQGNSFFNTPPLIEAADTPPFFHNNTAATVEAAVAFYTTDTFNNSISGAGNAFVLDSGQVNAIAALLRALNALENIRSSNAYAGQALGQELDRAADSVRLSIAETTDAIEVLTGGPVELFADTDAVPLLEQARELEQRALGEGLPDALLEEAIALKEQARGQMAQ